MLARIGQPAWQKSSRRPDSPPPDWPRTEGSFAPHELVKPAQLSILGAVLIQKCQIGLVEFAEEFVPFDLVKSIFRRPKINPKNTCVPVLLGGANRGRPSVALFCPFLDDPVIRRRCAVAHRHFPRFGLIDREQP